MENRNELAFEKCGVIQELNKVEGFNPLDYVTSSKNDRGEDYINLETKYRQLWFRLCYPHGKVTKKFLRLTDTVAAVEARVYLDKNDPEDNYIASGVAQRFFDPNKDFGLYYLESAETIAEGRALGKAGFGIQFCDFDGQKDDVMPDTGIKAQNFAAPAKKQEDKPEQKNTQSSKSVQSDNVKQTNGQTGAKQQAVQSTEEKAAPSGTEQQKLSDDIKPNTENKANNATNSVPANQPPTDSVQTDKVQADKVQTEAAETPQNNPQDSAVETAQEQTAEFDGHYDEHTPVEEILKVMTVAEAENIAVTIGFNRGKTLRQISLANFRQLRWFFESYTGDNNILKAGAKLLFDRSQQQQQKAS